MNATYTLRLLEAPSLTVECECGGREFVVRGPAPRDGARVVFSCSKCRQRRHTRNVAGRVRFTPTPPPLDSDVALGGYSPHPLTNLEGLK